MLTSARQGLKTAFNLQQNGQEIHQRVQAYQVLTNVGQRHMIKFTLEQAARDIEKNRMGDLKVTLVDEQGRPLTNASVDMQQVSHDFAFSVAWSSEAQYPGPAGSRLRIRQFRELVG